MATGGQGNAKITARGSS